MRLSVLFWLAAVIGAAGVARAAPPPDLPPAIWADPAPDAAHPARSEVLHIASHGVEINGLAYLVAGAGVHPTVVLFHGLPGNEKNLDLAQAIRRAGSPGRDRGSSHCPAGRGTTPPSGGRRPPPRDRPGR